MGIGTGSCKGQWLGKFWDTIERALNRTKKYICKCFSLNIKKLKFGYHQTGTFGAVTPCISAHSSVNLISK